jgi:hypothetical protein
MVAEDYPKLQRSPVGLKRGQAIAEALTARGFDVVLSTNPSNASARAHLREFSARAAGADLALAILLGHGISWNGQSFFLATNTEIDRAADLLSRALSITNIAQIAGRARTGGVFFLMTAPGFDAPIEGLDPRPQFTSEIARNVVAAFSNSTKVPVSRADASGELAAEALAKVFQQPVPTLAQAVTAASNDHLGMVVGTAPGESLVRSSPAATVEPAVLTTAGTALPDRKAALDGALETERSARERAESRALAEQLKAEQIQAELQRAQAEARKAQAEAERAQADSRKAQADAERAQAQAEVAKLEAKRVETQIQLAKAQAETPPSPTIPIDDTQLGPKQRLMIQERLRAKGLYTGEIDAVMGPLTREAIMGYQKIRKAAVTGFLTPDQFEALLSPER